MCKSYHMLDSNSCTQLLVHLIWKCSNRSHILKKCNDPRYITFSEILKYFYSYGFTQLYNKTVKFKLIKHTWGRILLKSFKTRGIYIIWNIIIERKPVHWETILGCIHSLLPNIWGCLWSLNIVNIKMLQLWDALNLAMQYNYRVNMVNKKVINSAGTKSGKYNRWVCSWILTTQKLSCMVWHIWGSKATSNFRADILTAFFQCCNFS